MSGSWNDTCCGFPAEKGTVMRPLAEPLVLQEPCLNSTLGFWSGGFVWVFGQVMSIRLPGICGEIPPKPKKLVRMSMLRGTDGSFRFRFLWSWPLCLSTGGGVNGRGLQVCQGGHCKPLPLMPPQNQQRRMALEEEKEEDEEEERQTQQENEKEKN